MKTTFVSGAATQLSAQSTHARQRLWILDVFCLALTMLVCGVNTDARAELRRTVQAVQATSKPNVRLYAIDCGRVEMDDMDFLADDGSMKEISGKSVVPCYLIRHPNGDLLWDTGLPDSMRDKTASPSSHIRFSISKSLVDSLSKLGLTPSKIRYLSMSHLHFDHAGNANMFASSTWIVDQRELNQAFSKQAKQRGETKNYRSLRRSKKIVFGNNGPYDVFGDGAVVIHEAPGHTPGHSVLLVKTARSGAILLAGDLWMSRASRQRKLVPRYVASKQQTLASMEYVEALAKSSGARVVIQHDPEDFKALPTFPQALE